MDLQSPRVVSAVRRNPPRKAKQTPYNQSLINVSTSCNSGAVAGVTPFDEHLLHSDRVQVDVLPSPKFPKVSDEESNNLKVFLRIRPLDGLARAAPNRISCETGGLGRGKVAKDRERKNSSCLFVNSSTSVTLNAPPSMLDSKRAKSEVYDGFSCIFPKESVQEDIYDKVMQPLVMAFMEGQSSLLIALGPTGSGKTYTMFGSHQHLGIVPLALRRIFCNVTENENMQFSRSYYMSMFEIHSERGKSEKILDLSPTSIDLSHQHATINNVTEVKISNLIDAEKFVAHGVLKRSTAPTNANNQSSRSQCVINIRCVLNSNNGSHSPCNPILTIVDLAGAERERKTGNQGSRLWESNFINNTSMVFGLCLRSLLEHQKNPKKPIEKHFKNSLLTRYLQDYMEGKKRMTLILTVKDGLEDYADTSFILRQASPYMKIKFNNLQDYNNAQCQKRNTALIRTEKWKRRKVNISKDSLVDCDNAAFHGVNRSQISEKDSVGEACIDNKNEEFGIELQTAKRGEEVMRNFARAFWSQLKQYKLRLKESKNEVQCLKESLTKHIAYASKLEKELEGLRNSCTCLKNLPTDECNKPLPVDHCDAVPLFLSSDHGNLKSADALHLEGNTPSIIENSDGAEVDRLALVLDKSCFEKGVKGNMIECPLSRQQSTLQQDVRPSDASFSVEENIKESQQTTSFEDCFDTNHPESFQSPPQSNLQLAEVHEREAGVKSSNIASLSGPQDRFPVNILVNELGFSGKTSSTLCSLPQPCGSLNENGCFSRFPEKEVSLIQEIKGQTEEILVLAQNAQLSPLNSRRPKRKLLPSSAMLLRDSDGPVVDENVKEFKGQAATTQGRSEGSLCLMRMLRSKLPR